MYISLSVIIILTLVIVYYTHRYLSLINVRNNINELVGWNNYGVHCNRIYENLTAPAPDKLEEVFRTLYDCYIIYITKQYAKTNTPERSKYLYAVTKQARKMKHKNDYFFIITFSDFIKLKALNYYGYTANIASLTSYSRVSRNYLIELEDYVNSHKKCVEIISAACEAYLAK